MWVWNVEQMDYELIGWWYMPTWQEEDLLPADLPMKYDWKISEDMPEVNIDEQLMNLWWFIKDLDDEDFIYVIHYLTMQRMSSPEEEDTED